MRTWRVELWVITLMLLNGASIVVYVMLNKNRYISRGLFGDRFRWNIYKGIVDTAGFRQPIISRASGAGLVQGVRVL